MSYSSGEPSQRRTVAAANRRSGEPSQRRTVAAANRRSGEPSRILYHISWVSVLNKGIFEINLMLNFIKLFKI
jgi:hypothetical protein